MSVDELQKKLIEKISSTTDAALPEELYNFIATDEAVGTYYKLSDKQLSMVEESRIQIREGKSITDDNLNKEIDQWLEK